ncbi:capsule assembly Wzi family protein [Spirosoma taeanense]|uniref:Capsule assembly Wzi family protein n=1 Tax=Spirosoma taeanense TaxID=2735870 RepID=A0A6M5Y0K6_9BACT|nr:capsule assembly Wzi family protein [Spirosoma taeanense]QJW88308.1 capsule assembly Wzi family protein [Spirosoma taeanense]
MNYKSRSAPRIAGYRAGLCLLACLNAAVGLAQSFRAPNAFSTEVGGFVSNSDVTPFWLRANQFGLVPNESPALTFRAGIYSGYDSTRRSTSRWRTSQYDFGYGINVVANSGSAITGNKLLLPEAYLKIRRGIWEVYVGRRRERFGLADSAISTGSYSWSGNALPVPKIQVAIPAFAPIGFTKGWVAIQGTYAHGLLDASGYIRNTMLHQKSFYVRLGRASEVVRLYGGFNHQVVWGGKAADPAGIPGVIPVGGKLPSSLIDYFYVVTGINSGRTDSTKYTYFDQTNRVGNHLGSIDLGFELDLVRHTIFAYRQSLFEDGSLASLINISDGLNGLRIRRNNPNALVRDILFELLNTTNQGGSVFIITEAKLRGKDNYFNHQQYRDGWAYRQHAIGTPFITPAISPDGAYPYGIFTLNNRVRVFHLGLAGSLPIRGSALTSPVAYQVKLSYSRNLGTYDVPYQPIRDQFSGYAGIMIPFSMLGGIQLTGNVAVDNGALYQNTFGAYISLRKIWSSRP